MKIIRKKILFCISTAFAMATAWCPAATAQAQDSADTVVSLSNIPTNQGKTDRIKHSRAKRGASLQGYPTIWHGNTVPFVFEDSSPKLQEVVRTVIKEFHNKTSVRFIERTDEEIFLRISSIDRGSSRTVSNSTGAKVNIATEGEFPEQVAHEFMHVLGFAHEFQRQDRDQYVQIDSVLNGPSFDSGPRIQPTGQYDIDAITHYSFMPLKNPAGIQYNTGHWIGRLSNGDIQQIHQKYPPADGSPPGSATVASSAPFADGVIEYGNASFTLASAPTIQLDRGERVLLRFRSSSLLHLTPAAPLELRPGVSYESNGLWKMSIFVLPNTPPGRYSLPVILTHGEWDAPKIDKLYLAVEVS